MPRQTNTLYWGGTRPIAAAGLDPPPVPAEIAQGTLLYRFIDLNRGWVEIAADGPWWFERESLTAIAQAAARDRRAPGSSARMYSSVSLEFETVNALVTARVANGPLLVWKGRSKLTESAPTTVPAVLQLYIPGFGPPYWKFWSFMQIYTAERIVAE